ncbi:MAG TPA: hypothetical protein VEA36_00990 [Candidatus Paceibacterota bacterium]|nr:hypothetical protein [Candidatus Paceibacterota bacterium]
MDLSGQRKFLLTQRFAAFVNRYDFFLGTDGERGERIGWAEQKRFNIKERITVWEGEGQETTLFAIQAEKVLDLHGKFFVEDGAGKQVGYLQKDFRSSLLSSTWNIHDAAGALLFTTTEKSELLALARRLSFLIPFVGEVIDLIPFQFVFLKDGVRVGEQVKRFRLRDTYVIEVTEALDGVDRRLILALAIALDELQGR